jgi:hypothetical protein
MTKFDLDDAPQTFTMALQVLALVISLVGLFCLGYSGIGLLNYGILGVSQTIVITGIVASVIAYILAKITDLVDKTDKTTMASVAEWISSTCLYAVLGVFIYIKLL